MTIIKNQRGIALVLVMIIALIALAIVSALIYMGTMGTRLSGAEKVYRNSDEAALGGARIAADMVIDQYWQCHGATESAFCCRGLRRQLWESELASVQKLNNATANWGGVCNAAMRSMDLLPTTTLGT